MITGEYTETMFRFIRNCKLSSSVTVPFQIPTKKNENESSASFPKCGIVKYMNFSHSNRCRVVPHYCFNLRFYNAKLYWASFNMLFAISISSLLEFLFRSFVHFLIELFAFSLLNFKCSLCILDTSTLSVVLQIFFPSLWLVLSFSW